MTEPTTAIDATELDVFCRCESYAECTGECCGPGNCSCDPEVRAESARLVVESASL